MSEVGIKSVSRLSDQVEEKIARANRAFRLSSRIVAAARDDLDGHGEWLDRHRATWTEEVKRQRRLLYRKVTLSALTRSVVGIVFAAPYAVWRALALKANGVLSRDPATEPLQGSPSRTISGLDGPLCTMAPVRSGNARPDIERPSRQEHVASQGLGGQEPEATRKRPASILGIVVLCLIAAGAVRATLSSPTGEAPALAAKKAHPIPPLKKAGRLPPPPPAAMLTVPKTPKPAKRPAAISGSVLLASRSDYAPVQMPPRTVTDIAVISRPLALASEPEATAEEPAASPDPAPLPVAETPAAAKPAVKPRPRRKVARRQPQPLPWWQQWSWMRLR